MGNLSSHETVETLRKYQDPYNFESYDDWVAPIANDGNVEDLSYNANKH